MSGGEVVLPISEAVMKEQYVLEEQMSAKGAKRLIKLINDAEKHAALSATSFGRFLISASIEKLSKRIRA
ncbi:MAG: hypothetical protein LBS75_00150, partial [Synergistaceae bacterium]|nr:hypothetical protein [Synergistaceae bacterium]